MRRYLFFFIGADTVFHQFTDPPVFNQQMNVHTNWLCSPPTQSTFSIAPDPCYNMFILAAHHLYLPYEQYCCVSFSFGCVYSTVLFTHIFQCCFISASSSCTSGNEITLEDIDGLVQDCSNSSALAFNGGFPSFRATSAELWCSTWLWPEQAVEQTVKLPIIWDALVLIWCHCNGWYPIMTSL